jgi:hypothetical protein
MIQKELRKLSQWFWKGFLKWYDGGGENKITSKKIFEVEVFFSSRNIDLPFIWRDSWSFSFSFSLFLYAPSLEDSGVLMIFEEKINSSKTSFEMAWHGIAWSWLRIYRWWTHILEWSHAHQYG